MTRSGFQRGPFSQACCKSFIIASRTNEEAAQMLDQAGRNCVVHEWAYLGGVVLQTMCLTEAKTRLWYSVWGWNCFCAIVCIRWSNCTGAALRCSRVNHWLMLTPFVWCAIGVGCTRYRYISTQYMCIITDQQQQQNIAEHRWGNGTEDESVFVASCFLHVDTGKTVGFRSEGACCSISFWLTGVS